LYNSRQRNAASCGKHWIPAFDSLSVDPHANNTKPIGATPEDMPMKSLVIKRSIVVAGHKTSVSLEEAFWSGLKKFAQNDNITLSKMVGDIDQRRHHRGNLSSAIRLFVLDRTRSQRPSNDNAGVFRLNGSSPRAQI
jgi:predicted DNA-binding ribbon-helix-helix protein